MKCVFAENISKYNFTVNRWQTFCFFCWFWFDVDVYTFTDEMMLQNVTTFILCLVKNRRNFTFKIYLWCKSFLKVFILIWCNSYYNILLKNCETLRSKFWNATKGVNASCRMISNCQIVKQFCESLTIQRKNKAKQSVIR